MRWDYSRSGVVAGITVMLVLCVASTAVRFWSRAVVLRGQYDADDWFCLTALLFTIVFLGLGLHLIPIGAGTHFKDLDDDERNEILKFFYLCSMLFSMAMGFAKFSVLAFYKRIFGGPSRHNLLVWTIPFCLVTFVSVGWLLMTVFYTAFRCHPVHAAWDWRLHNQCVSTPVEYLLVTGSVNVFADVIIVLLPIPSIWILNLPTRKKWLALGLLVFSSSVPLISIGRVVTVLCLGDDLNKDITYDLVPLCFWLIAEPPLSIFAISLPGAFQLIQRTRKWGWRSLFNPYDYHLRRHDSSGSLAMNFYYAHGRPLDLGRHQGGDVFSYIQADTGSSSSKTSPESDRSRPIERVNYLLPLEAIHVKTEVKVSYHS